MTNVMSVVGASKAYKQSRQYDDGKLHQPETGAIKAPTTASTLTRNKILSDSPEKVRSIRRQTRIASRGTGLTGEKREYATFSGVLQQYGMRCSTAAM
jgi:hypothetical protein